MNRGTGRSCLFFGVQYSATEFLYEAELKEYQEDGVLIKLDTTFSRNTEKKVYVKHKVLENSKELFKWLVDGAYFYVCRDKQFMAKDTTRLLILLKKSGMNCEAAEEYLTKMRKQKRYQRDVY